MTVTLLHGDCRELMAAMEPNSVDAVVCDPPYGLEFMGKEWDSLGARATKEKTTFDPNGQHIAQANGQRDQREHNEGGTWFGSRDGSAPTAFAPKRMPKCRKCGKWRYNGWKPRECTCDDPEWEHDTSTYPRTMQAWHETWAAEAFRVLKPGGHLLAFSGTRTSHRMVSAIEDAGFEIRDSLVWLQGAGFPKAWNFKTQYAGEWCDCDSGNAVSYDHQGVRHGEPQTEHDMRSMRGADLPPTVNDGDERWEVLQPLVPQPGASAYGEANSLGIDAGGEQSGMEGRPLHRAGQGLCDDSNAESSEGTAERLRVGTHPDSGADARSSVATGRGSPPSESESDGQSTGESPSLRDAHRALDDGALRNGGCCSRCGKLKTEYQGFATALKPAHEPICVARKPLAGTVAETVTRYGTGALNVDACRIEGAQAKPGGFLNPKIGTAAYGDFKGGPPRTMGDGASSPLGRWPANVILSHHEDCRPIGTRRVKGNASNGVAVRRSGVHAEAGGHQTIGREQPRTTHADADGTETVAAWDCARDPETGEFLCPVAALDAQSGERSSHDRRGGGGTARTPGYDGGFGPGRYAAGHGDTGGASRFFYTAKASRRERNAGLDGLPERDDGNFGTGGTKRLNDPAAKVVRGRSPVPSPPAANHHPTVKPVALMRWLVRLVTPPGGTVLDPFLGSGSTGIAAVLEGVNFIGCELDPEYLAIAERRIAHAQRHGERWLEAAKGPTPNVGRSGGWRQGGKAGYCPEHDAPRLDDGLGGVYTCGCPIVRGREYSTNDPQTIPDAPGRPDLTDLPLFAVAD